MKKFLSKQFLISVTATYVLLLCGHIQGAASSAGETSGSDWGQVATEYGDAATKPLQFPAPVFFKNNTNVNVKITFKATSGAIETLDLAAGAILPLSPSANSIVSAIGIKVTQGIVTGGNNLYGFQKFDIGGIIDNYMRDNNLSEDTPIQLTLGRKPGWLGIPSLTFNLVASPYIPVAETAASSAEDDEFQQIEDEEVSPESLQNLHNATFVFYNGSYHSAALTYEQDDERHRIIVKPGQTVNLGTHLSAGIQISTISLFGGTTSPLPMLAQYYRTVDFNLLDLLQGKASDGSPIYQISLPATSWNLSIDQIDTLPEKAILASALEQVLASERVAAESGTPFDVKAEIKMTELGQQLYQALTTEDQTKIDALKDQVASLYEGAPEDGLVKALALYFYFIGRKLGHVFEEGTFIVSDPSGKIYPFIEQLKGTYKRNASHFNALASNKLSEPKLWLAPLGAHHRGHDVNIPAMSKRTVLFNYLSPDKTVFYFKPETHGTHNLVDLMGHAGSFAVAQGRKHLPSIFGSDDQPSYSKERIPKELLRQFLKLIEPLPLDEETKATYARNATTYGIQSMYAQALALQKANPENEGILQFIQSLEAKQTARDPKYSYLNRRFGHEVILTPAEFAQFQEPIAETETFNITEGE